MGPSAEKLLKEALELSEAERADLAASLLESLGPEGDDLTDAAWQAEIQRRWDELESGKVQAVPWDVVKAKLQQQLDKFKDAGLSS